MRWSGQQVLDEGVGAEAALPGLRGLLRSVRTPEFAGAVFHEVEARSALNRVPGTSPVPFRWTVNPYRGCSHACVYCLAGPTRVLMADGSTRPIADLRVGDAVVGTEQVDGCRRYVRTTVRAHWSTVKPSVRLRLSGGTEIVASGEHRFLTDSGWRHVTGGWCRSGRRPRLRAGSALLGPGPFAGRTAAPTPGYRRGYLSGLVRADGPTPAEPDRCFPSAHLELEALGRAHHYLAEIGREVPVPVAVGGAVDGRIAPPVPRPARPGAGIAPVAEVVRWPESPGDDWCAGFLAGVVDARGAVAHGELRVRHADEEVVGRVAGALHRMGFGFVMETPDRGERIVRLTGGTAAYVRFLQLTGPAVGRRRDLSGAPVGVAAEVVAVEPTGRTVAMYDITTGTGDFVAEGVVSHNCFARGTHTYLDLDPGADFDSQIVVKVNVARVLDRELRRPSWAREPVAMGTNTDPYQRAEGRYRLMPGVIDALARSGTPFSLLTKGTVLTRDLPRLAAAARDVPVGLGVSIALLDRGLQTRLEPGTPSPGARLDLVRRIADAGMGCGVMVAPVLPLLTDSDDALDALFGRIAAAGATGVSVMALHLRPGTRDWFLAWLAREYPRLVEPYARLYRRGAYVDAEYRRALGARVVPLLRRHGLAASQGVVRGAPGPVESERAAVHAAEAEQLTLL
ncbi:intein-containing Rv2578c family radical SAM protein [Pseudonocardia abyssalis]|uniref:Intein-containing Rv2578c family radical SAM protein n=1 Tax=Pseudonocardia abyssalis TaxID=2792008 RepID=A0ABS6UQ60_9PSEU|nr:intein-containing Rv2578c family radical SAM protein [Pseudonocardia abyssalis]MBW0115531.1 intein-containing Rv2578c family radical SAM protein [Pseudonocardia abyssalis]MBW0134393.1 intein-containing Rv2578c family radical SAM protein [Pseudonocardia abyssalis]